MTPSPALSLDDDDVGSTNDAPSGPSASGLHVRSAHDPNLWPTMQSRNEYPVMGRGYNPTMFVSGIHPPDSSGHTTSLQRHDNRYQYGDLSQAYTTLPAPDARYLRAVLDMNAVNVTAIDITRPGATLDGGAMMPPATTNTPCFQQYQSPLSGSQPTEYPQQYNSALATAHPDIAHEPFAPANDILADRHYEQTRQGPDSCSGSPGTIDPYFDQQNFEPYPRALQIPVEISQQSGHPPHTMAPRSDNRETHSSPMVFGYHSLSSYADHPITHSNPSPLPSNGEGCLLRVGDDAASREARPFQAMGIAPHRVVINVASNVKTVGKKVKRFSCNTCRRRYMTDAGLRKHEAEDTCSRYQCTTCDWQFTEMKDLKRHRQSLHTTTIKYNCKPCNHETSRSDNLKRHKTSQRHLAMMRASRASEEDATSQAHEQATIEDGGVPLPVSSSGGGGYSMDDQGEIRRSIGTDAMDLDKRLTNAQSTYEASPQASRGLVISDRNGSLLEIQDNDLGYADPHDRSQRRRSDRHPHLGEAGPSTYWGRQSPVPHESLMQPSLAGENLPYPPWTPTDHDQQRDAQDLGHSRADASLHGQAEDEYQTIDNDDLYDMMADDSYT